MNLFNYDSIPVFWIILRAVLFVAFVAICCFAFREQVDVFIVGITVFVIGLMEWLLLIIPESPYTLDTVQGHNMGMYIAFITAIIALWKVYENKKRKAILYIGECIFAFHSISGIMVFLLTYKDWMDLFR